MLSSGAIVLGNLAPNLVHPLGGLSAEQRTTARVRALAQVLAEIAKRQSSGPSLARQEEC